MPQFEGWRDPRFLESIKAEVGTEAAPAFQWILDHARAIAGVVVAVVVIATCIGGWKWHEARKLAQAHLDVGLVEVTQTGEKRTESLTKLAASVPAQMRGAVLLEAAMTSQESGNEKLWQEAASEMTGPIASLAQLAAANSLLLSGNSQEAVSLLERLATTAEKPLSLLIQSQFAAAAEQAGEFSRAENAYQQLARETPDTNEGAFYLNRANVMQEKLKEK